MKIGVPKEIMAGEHRVALVPESAARLVAAGHHVLVETGAGAHAYIDDLAYAGAQVVPDPHTLYAHAELVLKVRAPARHPTHDYDEIALLREGTLLIALLQPLAAPERMRRLAARGVTSFSLDALPRITRAQGMDALSSMSTVAGYRAALLGATLLGRFFPLLMTAAGTVTPARVLVLGAGVAGLQAIATARRLGAIVQAFDTRVVVREQVQSLGASFLSMPLQQTAADAGGYARELSEDNYARERELLRDAVREADVVITTAMIPGARAPVLLSAEMVAAMRPGSVIVDLAAEAGGNCALTEPGQHVVAHDVIIEGPLNLPATMPVDASRLYSRNLLAFVTHLLAHGVVIDEQTGSRQLNLDDEIVRSTCITHAGQILHRATLERCVAAKGASPPDERQPSA
jgi:H+-translocating NAD(P) transhydrogenase subunit alpha